MHGLGRASYLAYDFGDHPLNPVRLDLTMRLARELGVLDRLDVARRRRPPTRTQLLDRARRRLPRGGAPRRATTRRSPATASAPTDDPVFAGMYDASALIAGGSAIAARQVWRGAVEHAVNIAGGLHHAMRGYASGFCVFNDVVLGIRTLLAAGAREGRLRRHRRASRRRRAGRVLRRPAGADDQPAPGSAHAVPGHRASRPRSAAARREGTSVNVALPPGTDDAGWLRAFRAVVPGAVRAFGPDVLVTQCGCDTHHEDPLANLELTVDGQRTAIADAARARARGRRRQVARVRRRRVRPGALRAAHLDAPARRGGRRARSRPETPIPPGWTAHLRDRGRARRAARHDGRRPRDPRRNRGRSAGLGAELGGPQIDTERLVAEARDQLGNCQGATIEARTAVGDPAVVLTDIARELDAQLVIVGRRGRDFVARTLLGSVAHRVVENAPCDVLVVA